MHHYMAYAIHTIPADSSAHSVWAYQVPQLAFSFPFLLHAVLAFSAHHLAHLNHDSRQAHYAVLASTHQTEAIHGLRGMLPQLGGENCHALFATACLLALIAFVDKHSLADLIDISLMLRGMSAIIDQTQDLLDAGPLAPLFALSLPIDPPECLATLLEELKGLEFARVIGSSQAASTAAWELRESIDFCIQHSQYPMLRVVTYWPIRVDNRFWKVVREGNDWACNQVLKWYAEILEKTAGEWWFLESWNKVNLIEHIREC